MEAQRQGKTDSGDARLQEVARSVMKDRAWAGFSSERPAAHRTTVSSDTTLDH